MTMPLVDLSDAPVVDAHCHGIDPAQLVRQPAGQWLDRMTVMGMCVGSASSTDAGMAAHVPAMTAGTIMALAARRWLAAHLGCPPGEVIAARDAALAADPAAYVTRLLASERVSGLMVDDGYPLPAVPPERMAALTGTAVHRVVRIEPLIIAARDRTAGPADLEREFTRLLDEALADPRTIACKSIIAYRTGLDVGAPSRQEVNRAYEHWRSAGWREGRDTSKAVRDHLLNVSVECCRPRRIPLHIHSGGGDPDVVLAHARPANLAPLLKRFMDHPVVLIHCGYPWVEEAAYLAAIYPLVYMDISLLVPWGTLDIERGLDLILGSVPTNKVFHGSDEASEPELIWLAARLTRRCLERVLSRAVSTDLLTADEAGTVGRNVLAANALRLHGLKENHA